MIKKKKEGSEREIELFTPPRMIGLNDICLTLRWPLQMLI